MPRVVAVGVDPASPALQAGNARLLQRGDRGRGGGDALLVEVEETVAAGASPAQARKWWTGEIARLANAADAEPASLISPTQVAGVVALVDEGVVNDKLARQVIEGVIAGEGTPAEVVEKRGLKVVSDDGPLIAAIDEALALWEPETHASHGLYTVGGR